RKPSPSGTGAAIRPIPPPDRASVELDRERPLVHQTKQGGHQAAPLSTRRSCSAPTDAMEESSPGEIPQAWQARREETAPAAAPQQATDLFDRISRGSVLRQIACEAEGRAEAVA